MRYLTEKQILLVKSANMFIDNIFSWRPIDDQWWITGFNPEYKGEKADAKNQVMIGSVDFSKHEEMYEAFKAKMELSQNESKREYILYDDKNKTVWICWYEKGLE